MKIWILGAGGQLGTSLIDCCEMMGILFIASKRSDIDITNLEQLKRHADKARCTHIINCAAYTDVDGAEKNSKHAYDVNALGPENLGIVARENAISLVHLSTDYIFNGEKTTPYVETDQPNPLNVYGKSKFEGEIRLLEQMPTACIVRTSWVFGHTGKNFISSILSLLQNKAHVQASDNQINRATYNRDLAKALLDLSCHSGIFHFANSKPTSRFRIVQDFYKEATERGFPLKCEKISPIFSYDTYRPSYSALDTKKVELVLGRKPLLWKTVLAEYFDHVTPLY